MPSKPTLAYPSIREENFFRGGKKFCHQKTTKSRYCINVQYESYTEKY